MLSKLKNEGQVVHNCDNHCTCRRWTCWEPLREMWTNLNPRAASLKTSDFFRAGFWCSNDDISGLYIATFDVQKYVCFRIMEMHGPGIWLVLQDLIPLKWSSKEIMCSRPNCCLIQFFPFPVEKYIWQNYNVGQKKWLHVPAGQIIPTRVIMQSTNQS